MRQKRWHSGVSSACKGACLLGILSLTACTSAPQTEFNKSLTDADKAALVKASELYMVDCLLPAPMRKLGNLTYFSPRKPIRTTGSDCNARGGDYEVYDRANYETALKTWLPAASEGDPEAQHHVAMIHEKGLDRQPDYKLAAQWYEKAAAQGYARSQMNLGYLYEQGLGVPQDRIKATNLYLAATGAEPNSVMLSETASKMIDEIRQESEQKISRLALQKDALVQQLASLEAKHNALANKHAQTVKEAQTAQRIQVDQEKQSDEQQLRELEQNIANLRSLVDETSQAQRAEQARQESLPITGEEIAMWRGRKNRVSTPKQGERDENETLDYGNFYALIIGNTEYDNMANLASPLNDVRRLSNLLSKRYGFKTITLENAREAEILLALNDFNKVVTEKDNLLIYFAGHGELTQSNTGTRRGYWLPKDAAAQRILHWIPNATINDHLDRISARSILVIADSCYAGYMASSGSHHRIGSLFSELSETAIRTGLSRRARLVISSGGVRPVLDGGGGKHSIFANALFDVLEQKDDVFSSGDLHAAISDAMRQQVQTANVAQKPNLQPIRSAGHLGGNFYFVPQAQTAATHTAPASQHLVDYQKSQPGAPDA